MNYLDTSAFVKYYRKEEEGSDKIIKLINDARNGRYAAFYRRNWGFLRIILEIKDPKLEITTFINTETMPNLKRLENGK